MAMLAATWAVAGAGPVGVAGAQPVEGMHSNAGAGAATAGRCTQLAKAGQPVAGAHGGGPGYDASVGNADNGHKFCTRVGERLLVLLRAPAGGPLWARPHASAPGYVAVAPMTMMLVRGATGANFRMVKPGTIYLRSTRRVCTPKAGSVACQAEQAWSVQLQILKR